VTLGFERLRFYVIIKFMKSTDANNSLPDSFARAARQIRDEAYAEGYDRALQDALHTLNELNPPSIRPAPVSLSTLILQKIEQHPDGILMRDITAWLNSIGDPRVAGRSDSQGRNAVSNALSLMKSKQGLVENRDGKWFRKLDSQSTQH
jgi:hypothetical protein